MDIYGVWQESHAELPNQRSAPELHGESTSSARKSFVASTLFKQRLTSKNVLPKKNIKYIAHPMKLLVMKND